MFNNPRRRRRRRNPSILSNPAGALGLGSYTHGIGGKEIAAAAGGLILANMLPPMLIKSTTTLTMSQKLMRIGVAFGASLLAGVGAKSALGSDAAKAAVAGGLAGTAVQTVKAFTTWNIGEGQMMLPAPQGGGSRVISESRTVSPPFARSDETVGLIMP